MGLDDTIKFGQYKGAKLGYLAKSDPKYVLWMINNFTRMKFDDDVVLTAKIAMKNKRKLKEIDRKIDKMLKF